VSRSGTGRALLLVVLTACGGFDAPMPLVGGAVERLEGVRFGMRPAELIALRPDGGYDDEGIYREGLDDSTVVGYGFLPWEEGRLPSGRARLAGVEIHEEVDDTVRLREAWTTAFDQIAAANVSRPECTVRRSFRLSRVTAAFSDTIRVTLDAEVVEGGDGQAYEAYLSTRIETAEMAMLSRSRREPEEPGRSVECRGFPIRMSAAR